MQGAAEEIVRAALERGPRRSPGVDSGDLQRFSDAIARRMQSGDELRTWADLEHRFRWRPEEQGPLIAAQELAREDIDTLLALFSSATPLAVQVVVPFIPWSDELGDRWLSAPCSRAIAALGLWRWLRSVPPTPENDEAFGRTVDRMGDVLARRSRSEEVALWWQALGIVHRVSSSNARGVPTRTRALYERAGVALARCGGGDALPSPEEWRLWEVGNHELAAVLPVVAHRGHEDERERLLNAFFADAERRLEGQAHELPDIAKPGGLLYANACGHAIALQVSAGILTPWWRKKLDDYLSRLSGWKADTSLTAAERAAWLACAAAFAALKLAKDSDESWQAIAPHLIEKVEPHIADWLWELGYPASARIALQELIVRVACLDPATAPGLVMRVVAVVQHAAALEIIVREARSVLTPGDTAEIERMVAQRTAYESALANGTTM